MQSYQRSVGKTLILALGEYEIEDFFETEYPDYESKNFSVCLLVLLAISGSLVMVQLFVASIVSDINELKDKCFFDEQITKSKQIIVGDSIRKMFCSKVKQLPEEDGDVSKPLNQSGDFTYQIRICPHSIYNCSKDPGTTVMDRLIVEGLKKILDKNGRTGMAPPLPNKPTSILTSPLRATLV